MITLADAKVRLNIASTAQDAVIQGVLDAAILIAEGYCRRRFLLRNETETFRYFRGRTLPLTRYPIVSVTALFDDGQASTGWEPIRGIGVIEFSQFVNARTITVSYTGGYDAATFPMDLALAIWSIFDVLWAQTPGGGITAGGVAASSGGMKSFSIPGVISINYDASGAASASAAGGAGAAAVIPPLAHSILNLYRREQA